MKKIYSFIRCVYLKMREDNITVYSAYASFYTVISLVPFLIMTLMLVGEFFSVSGNKLSDFLVSSFPFKVTTTVSYIIKDLASDSISLISLPIATLLWTASRAVVAVIKGIDVIYNINRRRRFIKLNFISIFFTLLFLVAILFALVIMVFGNVIIYGINLMFPSTKNVIKLFFLLRPIVSMLGLTLFFSLVYTFLPSSRQKYTKQLAGAVFSAAGWIVFSLCFSIYVDYFSTNSSVYGSLTALILLMLWIYFCMIIMFIGAEINHFLIKKSSD